MRTLEGKVAIVTGAGRPKGMGRAAALKLAEMGAKVVVTDICRERKELEIEGLLKIGDDFSALEKLVVDIENLGAKGIALAVDVTRTDEINVCVEKTCEVFGGVDILFNNAGVAIAVGPFLEIPLETWDLSWQVNVRGMMEFCKAVIPKMRERGGGSIINMSSAAGLGAQQEMAGYVTTKFGCVGLTKAIAAEFGRDNIRCNAICPGNILTDMGDAEIKFIADSHQLTEEAARNIFCAGSALGRGGKPEEIAALVAFLASDASSFLTGAAIPATGGLPLGV